MAGGDDTRRDVVLILGPTAGGKTELSVALAARLPGGGECISADSMQVYRGMDLGTAKPTEAERGGVPHHAIDVADPAEADYSVDQWLAEAERAIADIRSRGKWPIVVGGTNLYVQALLEGLFEGPPPDPALRERVRAMDAAERRAWLERIDPEAAARIHPNDAKRTVRAIEVHETTGRPISDLQREWDGRIRDDVVIIGLDWPVEAINRRINARVRAMIEAGLVEEVRRLDAAGGLGPQAREALGYKQILAHLEGAMTLEEAVEQIKIRTRRFAKQQRTWLRRFRVHRSSRWIDAGQRDTQAITEEALAFIIAPAANVPDGPPPNPESPDRSRIEG